MYKIIPLRNNPFGRSDTPISIVMYPRDEDNNFYDLLNEYEKLDKITTADYKVFITLLNPIAPHITEELNEKLGNNTMLAIGTWPTFDEEKTVDTSIQVGVQVNGKLRGTITVSDDDTEDIIKEKALNEDNVKKNIIDKEIVKIIVVPKRIVSIVVR